MLQYSTVQYSIVSTVQYSTVQYSTVQYSTVQYSTDFHFHLRVTEHIMPTKGGFLSVQVSTGLGCPQRSQQRWLFLFDLLSPDTSATVGYQGYNTKQPEIIFPPATVDYQGYNGKRMKHFCANNFTDKTNRKEPKT